MLTSLSKQHRYHPHQGIPKLQIEDTQIKILPLFLDKKSTKENYINNKVLPIKWSMAANTGHFSY